MSRVTPPVTKLVHASRGISTTAARSSNLLDQSRHVSIYLPRKLNELKAECNKRQIKSTGDKLALIDRLTAYDLGARDLHTRGQQRPTTRARRDAPLMQGFRTTPPRSSTYNPSAIDFFFFPPVPEPPPVNPFARLRVPLLPDNYAPDRSPNSVHAVEAMDGALPKPEISVVASHPEYVLPTAMSEVAGNDGIDTDLGFLTTGFAGTPSPSASKDSKPSKRERGFFNELLSGVKDDVFGSKPRHKA